MVKISRDSRGAAPARAAHPGPTTASPPPGSATPPCCSTCYGTSDPHRSGAGAAGRHRPRPREARPAPAGAPALARARAAAARSPAALARPHGPHRPRAPSLAAARRARGGAAGQPRSRAALPPRSRSWRGASRTEIAGLEGGVGGGPALGRADGDRPPPRVRRLSAARRGDRTVLFAGRHRLHRRVRRGSGSGRRSTSRSCRSARTTRGSPITRRPSRRGGCSRGWARTICCRCTTRRSG